MGVFITVDENVTDGDIKVTENTIWPVISVEWIGMGKGSVTDDQCQP